MSMSKGLVFKVHFSGKVSTRCVQYNLDEPWNEVLKKISKKAGLPVGTFVMRYAGRKITAKKWQSLRKD